MNRRLLTALALAAPLALAACSGSLPPFHVTSSGACSESDGLGASGGGFHLATGEPVLFFGTVLEKETRSYTYLVVGRDVLRGDDSFQQSHNVETSADGASLESSCDYLVDGTSFEAEFTASIEKRAIVDRSLKLNGRSIPEGQWLFVYDADDPEKGLVAVEHEMPALPRDMAKIGEFTVQFAAGLALDN